MELFESWQETPPANEMLSLLASAFTTWKPAGKRSTSPELVAETVTKMGGEALPISAMPDWMLISLADLEKTKGRPN